MLTRRTLLQMKAALLVLPVASKVAAGSAERPSSRLSGQVLFDDRIRDCNIFSDYARQSGATTYAVQDDITALYEALKPALEREPGTIVGLTPEPTAFLFDVMARDVGHHQAFRGEHYYSNGKLLGHRFAAPAYQLNEHDMLPGLDRNWSGELVELLSRFDTARISSARSCVRSSGEQIPQHDFTLVSWIIAPLPKA